MTFIDNLSLNKVVFLSLELILVSKSYIKNFFAFKANAIFSSLDFISQFNF